jgi:hypothetical protein
MIQSGNFWIHPRTKYCIFQDIFFVIHCTYSYFWPCTWQKEINTASFQWEVPLTHLMNTAAFYESAIYFQKNFFSTLIHKAKGKRLSCPCALTKHHHESVLGEWRYSSTHSQPLYSQRKSPCYPLDRSWVGARAVLDAVVKRKIPSPRRESNPRIPIAQPVAQRYTDWAITALHLYVSAVICFFAGQC